MRLTSLGNLFLCSLPWSVYLYKGWTVLTPKVNLKIDYWYFFQPKSHSSLWFKFNTKKMFNKRRLPLFVGLYLWTKHVPHASQNKSYCWIYRIFWLLSLCNISCIELTYKEKLTCQFRGFSKRAYPKVGQIITCQLRCAVSSFV